MGLNAVTSVPKYTDGEILEASRLNVTNSGIPVFADATARDAGFGGTGEKVLAEGQYAYLESTNATQYYDGAAWQTVGGGLTFISATTIGSAVSSVTVSNAFSSTYENYRVIVSGTGTGSAGFFTSITFGSTTSNYYNGTIFVNGSGTVSGAGGTTSSIPHVTAGTTNNHNGIFDIINPFITQRTMVTGSAYSISNGNSRSFVGYLDDATSYTAFTLTATGGTMTGGTIRVYGYQNS